MMWTVALPALVAVQLQLVEGHGQMTYPPTRLGALEMGAGFCSNGGCLWFSQGCQPGCSKCTNIPNQHDTCSEPGATMKPTLPEYARTYIDESFPTLDFNRHPWRSPGYSPVSNPCGVAGGYPGGPTYLLGPLGMKFGTGYPGMTPGTDLPRSNITEWQRGSSQPVKWSIEANHGGGYAYRLCPLSSDLTEECFQSGHLEFTPGKKTVIEWHHWDYVRTETIDNMVVTNGTWPIGSQWMRNPIPACDEKDGGVGQNFCPTPMFTPPLTNLYGAGVSQCLPRLPKNGNMCTIADIRYWISKFSFEIRDEVTVPTNIPSGDYVLSFRWDSEQTPQVWSTCSDIRVI